MPERRVSAKSLESRDRASFDHDSAADEIREISRFHMHWVAKLEDVASDRAIFERPEQRHELVLKVWEAVNSERELNAVLASSAALLVPLVQFQGIAAVAFGPAERRPFALHIVGRPPLAPGTAPALPRREPPSRPAIPYRGSEAGLKFKAGLPYQCADLLEKKAWLPHEFRLAAAGLRAYAAIPLVVRGSLIGLVSFTRRAPQAFTSEELALLSDVSRAIGVAVANALANDEIRALREQLEAENVELRTELSRVRGFEEIVGDSPELRTVREAVEQVAPTDATVLISGETGTGKELFVRALHKLSPRAHAPLVKVNCAAIPATLIAAELFGHERGAFTGAVERRKGRFEQANGGVLFLDEIGELSLDVQSTLLRVLQEREFERLGGQQTVKVDVRLVAATNRDLAEDVRAGRFRSDLYYRLNVFPIHIPPLRERPGDIAPMVAHFAAKYAERFGRKITRIDRRTMRALDSYSWPGNVRELENVIERAVILSKSGALVVDRDALPAAAPGVPIAADLRTREREIIEVALRNSAGRVAGPKGAALRLGVPASTLESKLKRLGVDKYRYRSGAPQS